MGMILDSRPALEAELFGPVAVATGPWSTVFITEPGRVLRLSADGFLSVYAGGAPGTSLGYSGDGGPATEATFQGGLPGLAVGPDGAVYVTDRANQRIRKIDLGGLVTTVAGTGNAGFSGDGGPATQADLNNPEGIALDVNGNLYVADWMNNRVRRVDANGTITTFAGTGKRGFSGDGGRAIQATFADPRGVAIANDGFVYIADSGNNRIRRVGPDGVVNTIAGSDWQFGFAGDGGLATKARFAGACALAVDAQGYLYIADTGNNRIRQISPVGTGTGRQGPLASLSVTTLAFENAIVGTSSQRVFDITNVGTETLTIEKITVAGSHAAEFSVAPAAAAVAPSERQAVTVTFAPTSVGAKTAYVAVTHNAPGSPGLIPLTGKGKLPNVVASADSLRMGRVAVGQTGSQVLTLTNNSGASVSVTNLVPGDPQYTVSSRLFALAAGSSRDVTVTFTPTEGRSPGSTLTVLTTDLEVPSLTIVLTAEVPAASAPAAIQVLPSSLNFGPVALGQSKTVSLTVSNTGGTPLRVVNVIASSSDITVSKSEFTVAPGADERLTVTLQPTQVGSFSETLDLPSNDPVHPLLQVPLRANVGSSGGKPSLSLDVTTLSFGQVAVGETGEFTLPVRNAGSGSLIISNAVSDNTQVAVSPTSLTIAPQETRSLTVRFRPVPGRERSGKVTIFSNDAVQPQVGVSWSAQDVKVPYLQITAIKPAEGAFNVGTSAEIQLTFSEPLYARRGFTALDLQVTPQPLSGPVEEDVQVRGDGRTVVIPVQLARNTVYRLVIYGATGRSGLELYDMVETSFSTGSAAPVVASVSGSVVVGEEASVSGSVYVFNPSYELVAQSPLSPSNGFEVKGLAEGSYTLYVDGVLSDGRQVTGSYDPSGDGVPDAVAVKAGVSQTDLRLVGVVVSNVPPVVGTNPVEADLDSTSGNQKLTALKVGAGQGVVLEVYANGVDQVTGSGVTVQYDTSKVWFVGAEEGTALLKQNKGTALFLSSVDPLNATVDFGGAIMGPTATTAVSGSGLLGRFRFKAVEGFTGSTELKVTHLALKTLSGTSQTDLGLTATLSSSSGTSGGGGGGTQPAGPGIRVSVGNVTGSASGTVVVPVSVDNAKGIAGGDMTLSYDANLLTAKQVQGSDLLTKAAITVIPNLSTPGKVQVSMAGVSGILSGSGVLLNVTFEVKSGAAQGSTPLSLEALLADENGATIPSTAAGGTVTIGGGMVGDVNNDQRVNSADAILVLRHSAGLTTLTEVQKQAGDVNGDGKTNSGDAILILRKSAGLLAQFPKAGKALAGTTDLVRLLPVERSGAELVVPVELGAGAAGADLVLRYGAGPIQVTQVDGPEGALLACQAEGSRMLRLSVAREEALAPVTVRLHLLGVNATSAVELVGQAYDEEGQVLGEVPTPLSRPACPKLAGYPNPFNASTTLQYELAEAGQVELVVYGLTGSAVRRLVSAWQGAGIHSAVWDGRNDDGLSVASGLYLARLQTGGARQIQKLMLLE